MRVRLAWHGYLGVALFLAGAAASLAQVEWVRIWFYQIAWWSYILVIDGAIKARAGNSLLIDRQASFWIMAFASATFWFGWEMINLRLMNWSYVGIPRGMAQRWIGAFIAYATVLPAVLSTYELLGLLGIFWGKGIKPLSQKLNWQPWFYAAGMIMFALALVWPGLFFPLVWGALTFWLEPVNYYKGTPSLMRSWEKGDLSPFVRLLLAGAICGIFWESWNFLASARWIYTLPYLNEPRLFAMPLAGYGGFPPFGVECFVFFSAVCILRGGRGWQASDHQKQFYQPISQGRAALLIAACLAFDILMCYLIDLYLVSGWL